MGLFSRRKTPVPTRGQRSINARTFGTWDWYNDKSIWHLSINNRLSSHIRMTLIEFTSQIGEIAPNQNFPQLPTPGKRIRISGMQWFGDDYRWFATIHGLDGRRYFFEKADQIIGQHHGFASKPRSHSEIDAIPFETDDELPDSPTHPPHAHVKEQDEKGKSVAPIINVSDESAAALLSIFHDFTLISYDDLCFFLFGGAKPWQEKVLGELNRRHENKSLDVHELNAAIIRYRAEINRTDFRKQQLMEVIEGKLRKAQEYGFDPPGGWGAVGPD